MPTGDPQSISLFPAQVSVPHTDLYIGMTIQSNGTPEADAALETVVQELVDLLQTWEGRLADVTAQLYGSTLASVTPTNPDPLPDPPEPEG